jgi:hypothetical protein
MLCTFYRNINKLSLNIVYTLNVIEKKSVIVFYFQNIKLNKMVYTLFLSIVCSYILRNIVLIKSESSNNMDTIF